MKTPTDKVNAADSCDISVQAKATCTLITATKPCIVTKEFSLNTDDTLDKKTTAHVIAGKMEVSEFSNLQEYADLLVSLKTNQSLIYGVPPHSPVDLVTKEAWLKNGCPESQIPRTNETMNLMWSNRSGHSS